jgi:hypothetical protein
VGVSIVGEDEAVPNSTGTDVMAERGRTVAGGDRVDAVHGEGERADVWAPLAEGERAQERKRLTGGVKRSAREGEHGATREDGPRWDESGGGSTAARERERGKAWAGISPAERGRGFSFFFFFFYFFLIPFLLYTNIPLYFLGAKMKCYV